MGFKWRQDPKLQILALYFKAGGGARAGAGRVVGTQTKFLAVVTSFELQDQPCARLCIMPSLLAKHLQTWTKS